MNVFHLITSFSHKTRSKTTANLVCNLLAPSRRTRLIQASITCPDISSIKDSKLLTREFSLDENVMVHVLDRQPQITLQFDRYIYVKIKRVSQYLFRHSLFIYHMANLKFSRDRETENGYGIVLEVGEQCHMVVMDGHIVHFEIGETYSKDHVEIENFRMMNFIVRKNIFTDENSEKWVLQKYEAFLDAAKYKRLMQNYFVNDIESLKTKLEYNKSNRSNVFFLMVHRAYGYVWAYEHIFQFNNTEKDGKTQDDRFKVVYETLKKYLSNPDTPAEDYINLLRDKKYQSMVCKLSYTRILELIPKSVYCEISDQIRQSFDLYQKKSSFINSVQREFLEELQNELGSIMKEPGNAPQSSSFFVQKGKTTIFKREQLSYNSRSINLGSAKTLLLSMNHSAGSNPFTDLYLLKNDQAGKTQMTLVDNTYLSHRILDRCQFIVQNNLYYV